VRLAPAQRPLWPYLKVAYTAGTRAVSPVTRAVSRRRSGWLPTRVAATAEDAVASGGRSVEVRPPLVLERAAPDGLPAAHPILAAQRREEVPRVAVAILPGGRVMHPHAAVVTGDGALVAEFSPYFGTRRPSEHPLFLHPFTGPPVDVDEPVAVLASRGDANYYHFLLDVLPKLALLAEAGVDTAGLLYAPLALPFQRELLVACGVDLDRVIDSARVPHLRARELAAAGLPDAHLRTPPWVVRFLRERLLPADVPATGRLYVTRGSRRHNRIVRNEQELLAALAPLGFTAVDPGALPLAEQIRLFAGAEAIVAPHGAALANLAFARPGTRVVELFPPDFVQGCYWKLADAVGLDYRYVVGAGRTPRATRLGRPDLMRGVASDIRIDPRSVVQALDSSGPSARAGRPDRSRVRTDEPVVGG
jgi:hypothetical protein